MSNLAIELVLGPDSNNNFPFEYEATKEIDKYKYRYSAAIELLENGLSYLIIDNTYKVTLKVYELGSPDEPKKLKKEFKGHVDYYSTFLRFQLNRLSDMSIVLRHKRKYDNSNQVTIFDVLASMEESS